MAINSGRQVCPARAICKGFTFGRASAAKKTSYHFISSSALGWLYMLVEQNWWGLHMFANCQLT
eukprot:scaffold387159_cov19-Prasinocladus_malaysianus.AAC.1